MPAADRDLSARDFLPAQRSLASAREAAARCRGCALWQHAWLELEIDLVGPEVVVCLEATAAHAVIGCSFSVLRDRGRLVSCALEPRVTGTVHPSALLRLPPTEDREAALRRFVEHLAAVKRALDRRD